MKSFKLILQIEKYDNNPQEYRQSGVNEIVIKNDHHYQKQKDDCLLAKNTFRIIQWKFDAGARLEYNPFSPLAMDPSFRFLEDSQTEGFGDLAAHNLSAAHQMLSMLDSASEYIVQTFRNQSEPVQTSPALIMGEKLERAGFNLHNQNLFCIQMVNALQAQMDVLERVIFKHAPPHSIFSYGLGFDQYLDESFCFEEELKIDQSQAYPIGRNANIKKISLIQPSKTYWTSQEEVKSIVGLNWASVSKEEQEHYLALRKKIDEVKRVIGDCLTKRQGNDHVCLLCGDIFQSGRQLGGHMSRKHPGNSADYNKKKKLHARKTVQRERRRYFKGFTNLALKKKNLSKKESPPCVKIEER